MADEENREERTVQILTDRDIQTMADQAPDSFSGRRNIELMRFWLRTGSRASESLDLVQGNLQAPDTIQLTPAKYDSERTMTVSESYFATLEEFVESENRPSSDFVFCNLDGNRLSGRYIREFVNDYALHAGLNPDTIYPHTFRHTFASQLLVTTGSIMKVRDALGHNDIRTTAKYIHTLPQTTTARIQREESVDLAEFEGSLPKRPPEADPLGSEKDE
jgi:integrase/recombinase XerD